MKRWISTIAACLLLLGTAMGLLSCAKDPEAPAVDMGPTYDAERLSEYLRLDAYTDLSVSLASADEGRGNAVWQAVLSRAEVIVYPEEAMDYYTRQEREAVAYFAEQKGLTTEEAMAALGLTEEGILENARAMVKSDLVYEYVRQDAGITLTDKEKRDLFDRYVGRIAVQHGYDEDDVRERMADLVYDAMLYDKTVEYLILHNTFTVVE